MFSKRATKIEKIFTVNLTLCSKSYKDFVKFCGLLRKHKLYHHQKVSNRIHTKNVHENSPKEKNSGGQKRQFTKSIHQNSPSENVH